MQVAIRFHGRVLAPMLVIIGALLLSTLGVGTAIPRASAGKPVYGGTLRIAYAGNMVSLDPAQAVNEDWYVINGELFNGLYQFDRAGQPQLDLAASAPTISADRTIWTFHLRKGVLFTNGMELTANDVKYSLTRVLDPHLKPAVSWGQSTDAPLYKGGPEFVAGKTKDVPGIQVLDRYTIRLVLNRPVAILPSILASSFNFIVPEAVVSKESADAFSDHPIGTGPFVLQSWHKGSMITFTRNPHYFHIGKPYLDKVIIDTNVSPSVIALRIQSGQVDGVGTTSDLNAVDIRQASSDPRYASYVIEAPGTFVVWMDLNTKSGPMANLALRQAVAMAINHRRLVQLLGGNATAATQLYMPLDPQHDPTLDQNPVYAYDAQKAATLVKSSGYHGQAITLLYGNDYTVASSIAPGIQQALQQIGLNVTLRGVAGTSLIGLVGPTTGHDLDITYWGADFPDAYDIYAGQVTCAQNVVGGQSGAHYCDTVADALVDKAEIQPLGAARDALLRQAQRRILQSASKVPLVFPKGIMMASPKIGGFYFEPLFGWQTENYWRMK